MIPDISYAIRLHELDQEASRLNKEVAALPKHIAEIEKKLEAHTRRLEADRTALAANQRERKSREDDIKVQEQKISKLRDQTSAAKTNDQYKAFQHEVEFCQKEIRRFEDRILELMEESEQLDRNVKAADVALKAERAQVESEKKDAETCTAADRAELATIAKTRAEIAAEIAPAVLESYNRARKKTGGGGVAEMLDGRCGVCQIALRQEVLQNLRRGDSMLPCENCSRLLYYNPPRSVDMVTGEVVS